MTAELAAFTEQCDSGSEDVVERKQQLHVAKAMAGKIQRETSELRHALEKLPTKLALLANVCERLKQDLIHPTEKGDQLESELKGQQNKLRELDLAVRALDEVYILIDPDHPLTARAGLTLCIPICLACHNNQDDSFHRIITNP